MGINTQAYLQPFFTNLRHKLAASGQKVEPVAPVCKIAPYEPQTYPGVVVHLSEQAKKKHEDCCGK